MWFCSYSADNGKDNPPQGLGFQTCLHEIWMEYAEMEMDGNGMK